jgi:replicative DNA helicase
MIERQLPQNVEAEQGVLGSILIDLECYDLVADSLKTDDFYRNAHQTIYAAMINLTARRIKPDFITLCDELDQTNKIEDAGGADYITSLINAVPTSGNIEYYAGIVVRSAECRRLIRYAGQVVAWAQAQDVDAMRKTEEALFALADHSTAQDFVAMPEMISEYLPELEHVHEHKGDYTGVPTGYTDIDKLLGGLQKSDLILLGGRPGSGKTSLGLCMGYNAALRGYKVAVFSLEMGRRQLTRRMTSMATKIDLQRLRSGWFDEDEWETIIAKMGDLSQLPLFVNDTAGNPIASMRSQLRRLSQRQNGIDLVIVDYLGLIAPEENTENRVQEISKISMGLKLLAREFDVPVLALAQLSRAVEQRQNKRPQLSDLRESGSLEQDADIVFFLYREDYYAEQEKRPEYVPTNEAEVNIAKHRNGPTGGVNLYFKGEQTMFYNLEQKFGQGRED